MVKSLVKKVISEIPFLKNRIDFYLFKKRYHQPKYVEQRKQMTSFYSQFIKEGDLCFDIGGNIGDFSQTFVDCGANVVCLEPQKYCFSFLKKRFRNTKNVVLIKKGVGSKEGEIELFLTSSHTIASMSPEWINKVKVSGRFAEFAWTKSETVKITTLDSLIAKYGKPKFCKIDVEGYEYEVIKGLSERIPYVSLEFTYEFLDNTVKIIEHLSALGNVEFNFMEGLGLKMISKEWIGSSEMVSFLRKSPNDYFGDLFIRYNS